MRKNMLKKLSIGIASIALIAPLALGGIQSTNIHADAVENNEGIKLMSHHSKRSVSLNRYIIRRINHMSLVQLKRSIRFNKHQLRKYKSHSRKARYSKILSIENNQLKKLNRLYSNNHSEKPSKATKAQKYEAEELRGITKQTNSLKSKLNRYSKKHNSRKSRNNIRTIKKELSKLSQEAKTLAITSLPKDA